MKIYVASSWRTPRQPEVVARLRAEGHEVYDFRNPAPGHQGFGWRQVRPEPPPWSAEVTREVLASPVAERGFGLDIAAMRWADAVVMLQPSGRSAALELGWCAGAGKRAVVLLADDQEPELMLKVADVLCTTLDEVVAALAAAWAPCPRFTPVGTWSPNPERWLCGCGPATNGNYAESLACADCGWVRP